MFKFCYKYNSLNGYHDHTYIRALSSQDGTRNNADFRSLVLHTRIRQQHSSSSTPAAPELASLWCSARRSFAREGHVAKRNASITLIVRQFTKATVHVLSPQTLNASDIQFIGQKAVVALPGFVAT